MLSDCYASKMHSASPRLAVSSSALVLPPRLRSLRSLSLGLLTSQPLRGCECLPLSPLAEPTRTQNVLRFYFVIEFRINSLRGSRYSASRFQYSLLVNCQSPLPRFLLTLFGKLFMELI